jgi:hypothetical protein
MWNRHAINYFSFLKRKAILPLGTALMKLEDSVISEKCQLQEDKFCMIPLK